MQTKSEYIYIIKKIVAKHKFFEGNEDLLETFTAEIYKRSYLALPTKNDTREVIRYLGIISNKVIQEVLKINSRPLKTAEEIKQIALQRQAEKRRKLAQEAMKLQERARKNPYRGYAAINDPLYSVSEKSTKSKMKRLISAVCEIHAKMPEKMYFQIFYHKYCKGLDQADVARKAGISQDELSRRLLSLVQILKSYDIKVD